MGYAPAFHGWSGFGWIPVLGILFPVFILAVIFGFVALMRYLRYRENLLMLQRGIVPERGWSRREYRQMPPHARLRVGIITSLVGVALVAGLATLGIGPWLLGGLIPLAVGIGEILTYILLTPTVDGVDRMDRMEEDDPGMRGDTDDRQ